MRHKLLQIGNFYVRIDLTILDRFNILLGLNYCEGAYKACTDITQTECMDFEYAEFQLGFLFLTFSLGKEQPILYGNRDQST